jgi:hypothetical protein
MFSAARSTLIPVVGKRVEREDRSDAHSTLFPPSPAAAGAGNVPLAGRAGLRGTKPSPIDGLVPAGLKDEPRETKSAIFLPREREERSAQRDLYGAGNELPAIQEQRSPQREHGGARNELPAAT